MKEDNKQPFPEGWDWESVRGAIFEKMDAMEKEVSEADNDKRRRPVFFLIFIFAGILGLWAWNKGNTSDTVLQQHDSKAVAQNLKQVADRDANGTEVVPSQHDEMPTSETMNSNAAEMRIDLDADRSLGALDKTVKRTIASGSETSLSTSTSVARTNTKERQGSATVSASTTEVRHLSTVGNTTSPIVSQFSVNEHRTSLLGTASDRGGENRLTLVFPFLSENGFGMVKSNSSNLVTLPSSDLFTILPDLNESKKDRHLLLVEAGVYWWTQGYGSNTPERASFESSLSSPTLQVQYNRDIGKNYFVLAGFQYQQLRSRFQYSAAIDDYTIQLNDTIVQVQIDAVTGAETIIRGDLDIAVDAERRVQHYNTSNLVKVMLGAGKSWHTQKWRVDLYVGTTCNVIVNNQGRTLYRGEIIDYDGSSNIVLDNALSFEGFIGARLHYMISRNISITSCLQLQRSITAWSGQTEVSMHPTTDALQVGFGYRM